MLSFEFTVSTLSDEGFVGEVVDRTPIFAAAMGRPIEIYLPTANGPVHGLVYVIALKGTEAYCRGLVDELGAAQLEELFGDGWNRPTMTMFGAAVCDLIVKSAPGVKPATP